MPRMSPDIADATWHPELLMAARCGDSERIERFLASGDVDVEISLVVMPHRRTPDELVTAAGDTLLHLVASSGDGDDFLRTAAVIYRKASYLLDTQNINGDTPLHCATRASKREMVTHLLHLARSDASVDHMRAFLRLQNKQGETVLHQAVRLGDRDMVGPLMVEDPELARVVSLAGHGASPLYLAVELGHHDIAQQLYIMDRGLSYSGPDGRCALHAAVLKGKDATKMLLDLERNKDLIKQADRSTGSTPFHFAASWGKHEVVSLLLKVAPSAAYQPDNNGSFPIHVAATAGKVKTVAVLLKNRLNCAELCDTKGRTFLHVAVKMQSLSVVRYACASQESASSLMNMQDIDGNTALHLAAETGSLRIFVALMNNRLVRLNVTNNMGQTPFDVSCMHAPPGIFYGLNTSRRICRMLQDAGAQTGTYRWDHFQEEHIRRLDPVEVEEIIKTSTQTIGFSSVLIATVAFAAAFTLPGGYRADDHENGGTPTLAGHTAFDVFIIANTVAFIFAGLSINSLISAGVDITITLRARMMHLASAAALMTGSARSLSAAFALGLYVVLAPVARGTAVASLAITALALVDTVLFMWTVCTVELVLLKRVRVRAWWKTAWAIVMMLLSQFWPYILIAGVATCCKIKRGH